MGFTGNFQVNGGVSDGDLNVDNDKTHGITGGHRLLFISTLREIAPQLVKSCPHWCFSMAEYGSWAEPGHDVASGDV